MPKTSYPWFNVISKVFIGVAAILGIAIMAIGTYDMIHTLNPKKDSSKSQIEAEIATIENQFQGKEYTLNGHKYEATDAHKLSNSGKPDQSGTAAGTEGVDQSPSPTEPSPHQTQTGFQTTRNDKNFQTVTEAAIGNPTVEFEEFPYYEVTGNPDFVATTTRNPYPNSPQGGGSKGGFRFPEGESESDFRNPTQPSFTGDVRFGNQGSAGQTNEWSPNRKQPFRDGNSIQNPKTGEPDSQPPLRGRDLRKSHTRHFRYKRQTGQESPSEDTANPSVQDASKEIEKTHKGQKKYRLILVICQVVAIILGFIQLVSSFGIVCSCSPYVPKRVRTWLIITTFLFLIGLLCLIVPLSLDPKDGSTLNTSEFSDSLKQKFKDLDEMNKKEIYLRNLFFYSMGINQGFLLLSILVVGILLPLGTQPYDSVY